MEARESDRLAIGARIPSGTVAFLFTDIEGSTKRWERFGSAMRDAVARHDALLTRIFAEHQAYVFKTLGDAFCVAFASVHDAVRAAVAAQRAVLSEDWSMVEGLPVRMAINVGATDERDGDYFGPVVNRVARLLGVAHGGQIVLSAAARQLAQAALPPDVSLDDLGDHRLKDLSQPERVAQLSVRGLRTEFPRLLSLDVAQTNLPVQFAPLIGREREVERIAALVRTKPLVSLCGAGGIGKTRIACQVGAELLAEYPDGAWFIDLAPITDPALVITTLAATFGISDIGSGQLIDRAVGTLANRRLLLIFDNCEHVVGAVATVVDAILRGCAGTRILVTTREALHVHGEELYRVPSLDVPDRVEGLTAPQALRFASVGLFVARISSIAPFTLTDDNAPIVADICRRLDGIALAIELAASRVKVLSPQQVAQRLDERFRMLTGGSRTALPRQQTLRALIDWSHDLLGERERIVFRRTSVFAASFDLNAAIAVCSDEAIDEWDVVDLLDALVDKSLVSVEFAGEERRYRLPESMRAYARERFAQAAEDGSIRQRWFAHYWALAHHRGAGHRANLDDTEFAALEIENDNFRSLLEWSIAAGNDPAGGLDLAAVLGVYWGLIGLQPEGFAWLEAGLRLVDESVRPAAIAQGWLAIASLGQNMLLGERALDAANRAIALGREADLPTVVARALLYAGNALDRLGRHDEAAESFDRALGPLRELGDRRGVFMCLFSQAGNAAVRGREREARDRYEEVRLMQPVSGNVRSRAVVSANLALLEFHCGNRERALELSEECVELARRLTDKLLLAYLHVNRAAILIDADRTDEARATAREALALAGERQYAIAHAIAIEHLAGLAALRGGVESAALLVGYTERSMQAAGFAREAIEQRGFDRLVAAVRARVDDAAFAQLRADGSQLSGEAAAELAGRL